MAGELATAGEGETVARSGSARLSELPLLGRGVIVGFDLPPADPAQPLTPPELECRLVEIGFVEGAEVEVAHLGGLRGDPVGVRIDGRRLVALRRRDAACIRVGPAAP